MLKKLCTCITYVFLFVGMFGCEKSSIDVSKIESVYPDKKSDYVRVSDLLMRPDEFHNGYVCVMGPYQHELSGKGFVDSDDLSHVNESISKFLLSKKYRVPEGKWSIILVSKSGDVSVSEVNRYKTPLILFDSTGGISKDSSGRYPVECALFENSEIGEFVENGSAIGVSLYDVKMRGE